jgi:hypothetical protein
MEIRYYLLSYFILCFFTLSNAQQSYEQLSVRTFDPPKDSILPQELHNYRLQVLEKTKSVIIKVNGGTIDTSVPIFIYVPKSNTREGIDLINKGIVALERLSKMPDWSQDDINYVLNSLRQGIVVINNKSNQ